MKGYHLLFTEKIISDTNTVGNESSCVISECNQSWQCFARVFSIESKADSSTDLSYNSTRYNGQPCLMNAPWASIYIVFCTLVGMRDGLRRRDIKLCRGFSSLHCCWGFLDRYHVIESFSCSSSFLRDWLVLCGRARMPDDWGRRELERRSVSLKCYGIRHLLNHPRTEPARGLKPDAQVYGPYSLLHVHKGLKFDRNFTEIDPYQSKCVPCSWPLLWRWKRWFYQLAWSANRLCSYFRFKRQLTKVWDI